MGLIAVGSGNVYHFTTIGTDTNIIAQIAGSNEVFKKTFLTGLTLSGNAAATLTTQTGSRATLNGITEINGILEYSAFEVDTTTSTTSSITTNTQWQATGSFLQLSGGSNHLVRPGNTGTMNGRVLKILKDDAGSSLITVDPSSGNINGATSISSSSPYAYIEIIYINFSTWRIINTVGTWT
jgi:hypothetical protein